MSLFAPAWMSQNLQKALKAVEKIKDDGQLFEIAHYHKGQDKAVRQAALDRIGDEKLLYQVAMDVKGFSEEQRSEVVRRIRDPKLLMDLAQHAMTSQSTLQNSVELHGYYKSVRTAAVAQIESEDLLEAIADAPDWDGSDLNAGTRGYHNAQANVVKAAVFRISDPERLRRLALSGRSNTTCESAVDRLFQLKADRSVLNGIARGSDNYYGRKRAMAALLGRPGMSDGELAAQMKNQDFLYDFAKNQPNMGSGFNDYDRATAVGKLNDPARVSEFLDFNNTEVRRAAENRLKALKARSEA